MTFIEGRRSTHLGPTPPYAEYEPELRDALTVGRAIADE